MAITLKELRDLARDQADQEDSSSATNDYISDSKLNYWINASLRELYDLLVDSFEDYFSKTLNITLVAAQSEYDLPGDFYKLGKLFYIDQSNKRYRLRRFNLDQLPSITDPFVVPVTADAGMYYRVMGEHLYLYPAPTSTNTLEMWYIPGLVRLRIDEDQININVPIMWEDYVVCDVAARCLIKEESDPSALMAKKAEIKEHIIQSAQNRDAGMPNKVVDIYPTVDVEW